MVAMRLLRRETAKPERSKQIVTKEVKEQYRVEHVLYKQWSTILLLSNLTIRMIFFKLCVMTFKKQLISILTHIKIP
jgi:cell division protein FtsL